jgi:hypothetical protein
VRMGSVGMGVRFPRRVGGQLSAQLLSYSRSICQLPGRKKAIE